MTLSLFRIPFRLRPRLLRHRTLLWLLHIDTRPACFRKSDSDGLLRIPYPMLPGPYIVDLLFHKLTRLRTG